MNNTVPAIANKLATTIFIITLAPGASTIITNNPKLADWVVPTREGSTNRFWVSSCIIKPATLMALPAKSKATVLGTRLTKKICRILLSDQRSTKVTCPAPINKLNAAIANKKTMPAIK